MKFFNGPGKKPMAEVTQRHRDMAAKAICRCVDSGNMFCGVHNTLMLIADKSVCVTVHRAARLIADTEARIYEHLMQHDFDCQMDPGIGCEACVRENVAGEILRGEYVKKDTNE